MIESFDQGVSSKKQLLINLNKLIYMLQFDDGLNERLKCCLLLTGFEYLFFNCLEEIKVDILIWGHYPLFV